MYNTLNVSFRIFATQHIYSSDTQLWLLRKKNIWILSMRVA